ncbi:MAG: DoxX family protein [Pseudomonadota bacterium]
MNLPAIVVTILTVLLSAFFVLTSSIKIFAWNKKVFDMQMAFMRKYGLTRQHFFAIGVIEMVSAIGLWFQDSWIAPASALALCIVSIGAIVFHLKFDTWTAGIPAFVTACLSGVLFYAYLPSVVALLGA